jgi:hypothetical protein
MLLQQISKNIKMFFQMENITIIWQDAIDFFGDKAN